MRRREELGSAMPSEKNWRIGKRLGAMQAIYFTVVAMYLISLLLPGVIYQSSPLANPKKDECAAATLPDWVCFSFTFGKAGLEECAAKKYLSPRDAARTVVDRSKILEYCAGWDAPVASNDPGLILLAFGWLGVFVGITAWFANPFGLFAFLAATLRFYKVAFVLSLAAFGLGLDAYAFHEKGLNEGGAPWLEVDRLASGYYVWQASFALLAAYCLAMALKARRTSPHPPMSP